MFLELVSDNASAFKGVLMQELAKVVGAKLVRISSHHPLSNGKTERAIKVVKAAIAKYCAPNQKDWDSMLPAIQFGINTSRHSSMSESPYAMVYNRQPVFPSELFANPDFNHDIVDEIHTRLALADEIIENNYRKQQARDKKRFDERHTLPLFTPGTWVLVHTPKTKKGHSTKLLPIFNGPFEIIRQISDVTYAVRMGHSEDSPIKPINIRRLKEFFTRDIASSSEDSS
jgi:hypothetical protein